MNAEGKSRADQALSRIDPGKGTGTHGRQRFRALFLLNRHARAPDDTTNTWDALRTAWAVARDSALADYDNVSSTCVLHCNFVTLCGEGQHLAAH